MLGLFGNPSYQGSTLERLVNASSAQAIQFNDANIAIFVQALRQEYPQPLDHFLQVTNQTLTLEDKVRDVANHTLAISSAAKGLWLIGFAANMAQYYGSQIDQLKMTNAGAAYALAASLAEYVHACNIPADQCQGGYRQHLSAYLILRDSMEAFGFLGSWEQRIADFETEQRRTHPEFVAPKLNPQETAVLRSLVPRSEQHVLSQVLQQLNNTVRSVIGWMNMAPGILDVMYLQMVLGMPQLSMTGQWSGSPMAMSANGRCTFCGGPAPCQPCESRLMQVAAMSRSGFGGVGASQMGPAGTQAAQMLINAGINPFR